jgi:PKD repeat protein
MLSSPALKVHPVTGEITGTTWMVGMYSVAFCVEEWRNGALIGTYVMDVTICVTENCGGATIYGTDANGAVTICDGYTVSFDAEGQFGSNQFFWDFGDTTTLADTSLLEDPTYTYPDTGIYIATLSTNSPICNDTAQVMVIVRGSIGLSVLATPDIFVCHGEYVLLHALPSSQSVSYWWEPSYRVMDADSQQTMTSYGYSQHYVVTVTDSLGCTASDTASITTSLTLAMYILGLDPSYTTSSTPDSLIGFPPGGTFSGPGITDTIFDPSLAGVGTHIIYYTYTDWAGCVSVDSAITEVLCDLMVSLSGLDSAYAVSDPPDTLVGSPAGGSFSGPGVISGVFHPANAGIGTHIIFYSFTDSFGCSDTDSMTTTVDSITAIEVVYQEIVSVHPNPTDDLLHITLKRPIDGTLRVFDVSGRVVKEEKLVGQSHALYMEHLSPGAYVLHISSDDVNSRLIFVRQ